MTEPDLSGLSRLLADRTGLHFPAGRQAMVGAELECLRTEAGFDSIPDLLDRMHTDSSLLDTFISKITVPESYFFRDPAHFDFIRDTVIPATLKLRPPGHIFKVWSAGCAGGEEAYSLAMLFEETGQGDSLRLLASDISRRALTHARKGNYSAWSLRGERAQCLPEAFIARQGKRFQVAERFRDKVTFSYLNLAGSNYPSAASGTQGLDLILCRNVLIYLRPEAVEHVARRLYESLAPGGYLIPGPSDPLLSGMAPFEVQLAPNGLIYRKPRSERHDMVGQPVREALPPELPVRTAAVRRKQRFIQKLIPSPQKLTPLSGSAESPVLRDQEAALYREALLLMQQSRDEEALKVLRKLLYLSPELLVAHFTMGLIYRRLGSRTEAIRAFRNAYDLADNLPQDYPLPLAGDESAQQLAQAASLQLRIYGIDVPGSRGDRV